MSAKRRRSKRIAKSERVLLNLATPVQLQDIVVTIEASAHGAKVLARRKMVPEARGVAVLISAGRQVPCRIAWQRPPGADGRMETGIEIYSNTNFWGHDLSGSEVEPEPAVAPVVSELTPHAVTVRASAADIVQELKNQYGSPNLPVDLWCVLVDSLENKGVFAREDLIVMLRRIGSGLAH